jgi:hypothetical protein
MTFNVFYPEKFELLLQRDINSQNNIIETESKIHHFLRETNYVLGSFIGNKRYALNILKKAIFQIQEFCLKNNIEFLLLGPVSRPFSKFENNLSNEINRKFKMFTSESAINYLDLIKRVTNDNRPMFFDNGIHVSQAGHDEIANMIYDKINEKSFL